MSNNKPHPQLEEQPPLPHDATCRQCGHGLDMTHGAAYWHNEWYCQPCFAQGRRR